MKTPVMNRAIKKKVKPDLDMTPECYLCGHKHIGIMENAVVIFKGQWYESSEYAVPVFVLDPDTQLRVLEMPNGQLVMVPDTFGHPTKHAHTDCMELMSQEFVDEEEEEDDEDEDEDDDEYVYEED